ncbi:MAG: HDIG domain-containing protein [Bacteroidales bacterium]|nr:HDIG domain-containing protein [Bacteroidales bacterium]MCF8332935.1 HDIG domain-containing protein [Bacteroidales bacterium]
MNKLFDYLRDNYSTIYKIFLLVITIVIIVSFFPKVGKFKYEYHKGKPWMYADLIAPYDFPIYKTEKQLEEDRTKALKNFNPYFTFNTPESKQTRKDFKENFQQLWINNYGNLDERYEKNKQFAAGILDSILKRGIIRRNQEIKNKSGDFEIILIKDKVARKRSLHSFYTVKEADNRIEQAVQKAADTTNIIEDNLVYTALQDALSQNVDYDEKKSAEAKERLLSEVSLTRGMVQKGERIIARGEVVTPTKYQVLKSFEKQYREKIRVSGNQDWITTGQAMVITILMLVLFLFYYFFRHSIFEENKKIIFVFFVMLLMVLITSLVGKYNVGYIYVIPISVVPILIRIFFDARFAIVIHLVTVMILGFLAPNGFDFVILNIVAGMMAIMSIVQLHRRAQFFMTSLLIFVTYSLVYTGLQLMQQGNPADLEPVHYGYFAANAILTLFAYPLIYIFEKSFGMVTDITLLELSDTNSPLLRSLVTKAPGTFQHSMQVANLSEEAIREIGGNALLVRTGALYHDIGKMNMPVYFVENQKAGMNPHDELSYEESAKIIISHVIRGVEMGKKRGLPEHIIDFIRTHHGTRKADYFYMKRKQEDPEGTVDEKEFSYHGPVPFSKETAVLMMADSVEAASRSLKAPDENKINELVENIINRLIAEEQLNNANITFKDIRIVKKILKRQLMNIYHVRVAYPE